LPTLTIRNVPGRLVRRLKSRAVRHRRSLSHEVIACLEMATRAAPVDPEALLARIRAVRRTPTDFRLTDRTLARLKAEGRP
jgi:plasmid stability protein